MMALEGIKVLDLSRGYPAAYCAMILADLGADVLRIDPPGRRPPFPVADEESFYAYWCWERNKRGMALNLQLEEGRHIFCRLAEGADVVIDGFRPGVLKRMGVDYETVSELNPRIIYCSLTGYGQDGPYRDLPGHDPNYISVAGALGIITDQSGWPVLPSNLVADMGGGGMHAAVGVLAALMARERTGRGQHVDIAMTDGVVSLLSGIVSQHFLSGTAPGMDTMPFIGVYETSDGRYVTIACLEPRFWENLCRALGREDLIPYQYAEGEKREEIVSFLREAFLKRTRDEWFELLKEGTCIAPVYTLDEAFRDPQVQHRQMIVEIDHPRLGKVKQVGISIKLSDTPGQVRHAGTLPGTDTEEVLLGLGYSSKEIEELRQKGVT